MFFPILEGRAPGAPPLDYSFYKTADQYLTRKGPDCDYDKRNISTAIYHGQNNLFLDTI